MPDEMEMNKEKVAEGTYNSQLEGTCSRCETNANELEKVKAKISRLERKLGSVSQFNLRIMHSSTISLCLM